MNDNMLLVFAMSAASMALLSCHKGDCVSDLPAIRAEVGLAGEVDERRVASLRVTLTQGGTPRAPRTLAVDHDELNDRTTSFEVTLSASGPLSGTLLVEALDDQAVLLARASRDFAVASDACTSVHLTLASTTAVDAGPGDFRPDANRCAVTACTWAVMSKEFSGREGPRRVAVDGQGNVYVTGYFQRDFTFGHDALSVGKGKLDIFLVKLHADGLVAWARRIGNDASDSTRNMGWDVVTDAQGYLYLTGEMEGTAAFGDKKLTASGGAADWDAFVVKVDPRGTAPSVIWAVQAGGSARDRGLALASDGKGGLYLSGYTQSKSVTFGSGGSVRLTGAGGASLNERLFVAKLRASDGNFDWATSAGGEQAEVHATGIAADASGNTVVAGTFFRYEKGQDVTAKFGAHTVKSSLCAKDPQNYCYTNFLAALSYDKTSGPTWHWAIPGGQRFDGEYPHLVFRRTSVAVDSRGQVHYAATFQSEVAFNSGAIKRTSSGSDDIVVARLNGAGKNQGKVTWAVRLGGTGEDHATGVAADAAGNTLISGWSTAGSPSSRDAYVARLSDAEGKALWTTHEGGTGEDQAYDIAAGPADTVVVMGTIRGPVHFDGHPKDNKGTTLKETTVNWDMFVWRLNDDGSYP